MKKSLFLLIFIYWVSFSQQTIFNVEEYKRFYNENKNLTYDGLLNKYPIQNFLNKIYFENNINYLDSIKNKYQLTSDELSLIKDFGFIVTERLSYNSFASAFSDIYHKDLPVYVSTDAILHAVHMSYDEILKQIEIDILIPKLKTLLKNLSDNLSNLDVKYSQNILFEKSLKDIDLYITVARYLLNEANTPYYKENITFLKEIINNINKLSPTSIKLFSSSNRIFDFSQFKVRGHYNDQYHPELALYFQTMIWLGKTEFYFSSPQAIQQQNIEDIQRQIIDAFLLKELLSSSNSESIYNEINKILEAFIGEQDNITIDNLKYLENKLQITDIRVFSDTGYVSYFQNELINEPFSDQKILSQILMTDLSGPQVKPGMAFLLFGQRFIVDSYILSKVVFSNIIYENRLIPRLLPSPLDILFVLGNNSASKLLERELKEYHYASNLNALRFLLDSYGEDFWEKSLYNIWLSSIKSLNPPEDLSKYPKSLQTAAYWQSKMISQLACWAELRHDNLLYTKQSYTGGVICSFPYTYIDPFPKFYEKIVKFAGKAINILRDVNYNNSYMFDYFIKLEKVCSNLQIIAQKELDNKELSETDKAFLSEMLRLKNICGMEYDGWYPQLYFRGEDSFKKTDYVIADIHTTPTDENGNMVGWIKHAATGSLNMAIILANNYNGEKTLFIGPVLSFYDYTTTNFQRLNDDEWQKIYTQSLINQPDFSNIFMTDKKGEKKPFGPTILTNINIEKPKPESYLLIKNYPNPFNPSTNIIFTIPDELSGKNCSINIYDNVGKLVKRLLYENLTKGTYVIKWDGKDESGKLCSSGLYIAQITSANKSAIIKMSLIK